ncbi:MAG: hypothetical protein KAK00_08450 [Nanoarchaeota archaeon]|nr:hypothetical protein [Thermodesulfovibrionia bacterium]MCK5283412.1 hypothetical protein [Nanoarchaeota archaeon]
MKKIIIILIVVFSVFLYGCEKVVCNAPYIQVGKDCCLDTDNNKICDKDEEFEESSRIVIIEKEPPEIIEKEVKVIEYVCSDGSVVDDISNCPIEESQPIEEVVEEKIVIPELLTTNEEDTVIEEVTVDTACISGENGGKIFFKVGTVPSEIVFQIKEAGGEYSDVFIRGGVYEQFSYFAICDSCWGTQIDFKLKPDKVYVLRVVFDQTVYNRTEYSNEHLIDTREESEYMTKICSK